MGSVVAVFSLLPTKMRPTVAQRVHAIIKCINFGQGSKGGANSPCLSRAVQLRASDIKYSPNGFESRRSFQCHFRTASRRGSLRENDTNTDKGPRSDPTFNTDCLIELAERLQLFPSTSEVQKLTSPRVESMRPYGNHLSLRWIG